MSNLCYGTGKFRRMLLTAETSPVDFIKTLTSILESVMKPDLAQMFGESTENSKEAEKERILDEDKQTEHEMEQNALP